MKKNLFDIMCRRSLKPRLYGKIFNLNLTKIEGCMQMCVNW